MPAKRIEARSNPMLEMPATTLRKELGLAANELRAIARTGAYGKASFTVIMSKDGARIVRLSFESLKAIRRFHKKYVSITHAAREIEASDDGIKKAVKLFDTLGKHRLAGELLKLTGGKIGFKTYGKRHFIETKRISDLQRLVSALPTYHTTDRIKYVVERLRPPDFKVLPPSYQVFESARKKLEKKEGGLKLAILELLEHARKQHGLEDGYALEQLAEKSFDKLTERHLEAEVSETPLLARRVFNEAGLKEKRRIQSYISALVALELPQILEHNLFQGLVQKQPEERPNAILRVLERLDHQAYRKHFDQNHLLGAIDASAREASTAAQLVQQKHFPQNTEIMQQLERLSEQKLQELHRDFKLPTGLPPTGRLKAMLEQLEAEKAKKGAGASLADRRDRSRRRKTGEKKR